MEIDADAAKCKHAKVVYSCDECCVQECEHGKHIYMCCACTGPGAGICAESAAPVFAAMDKARAAGVLEGIVRKDKAARGVAGVLEEMIKQSHIASAPERKQRKERLADLMAEEGSSALKSTPAGFEGASGCRQLEKFRDEVRGREQQKLDEWLRKLFDDDLKPAAVVLGEISKLSPASAAEVLLQMDGNSALDLLVVMTAQRFDHTAVVREMKQGSSQQLDEESADIMDDLLKKKQEQYVLRHFDNLLGPKLMKGDEVRYKRPQCNFYSVAKDVKFPTPSWDRPETLINVSAAAPCAKNASCGHLGWA